MTFLTVHLNFDPVRQTQSGRLWSLAVAEVVRSSTDGRGSVSEQLFTCKLGGRNPTHSGKSPTHSRHFAQMGQSIIFRYRILWPVERVVPIYLNTV